MQYRGGKVTIFMAVLAGCSLGYAQQKNIDNGKTAATQLTRSGQTNSDGDLTEGSPNSFYPSFSHFDSPPLGHSRPFYYQNNNNQEGAYSQRSQPFEQLFEGPEKFSGFAKEDYIPVPEAPKSDNILGSGNFGVIKGGTFFNDDDGDHSSNYGDYDSYYQNGHGRPSYYNKQSSNSKPRYQQFANFKDFADINTPSIRQYSQKVNIYVNKGDSDVAESKEDDSMTDKDNGEEVDENDTKKSSDDMESFSMKQSEQNSDDDKVITLYPVIRHNTNSTDNSTASGNQLKVVVASFHNILEILTRINSFDGGKSNEANNDTVVTPNNRSSSENLEDGNDDSDIFIEVMKLPTESTAPPSTSLLTDYKSSSANTITESINKNGPEIYPKNIIESLALLDSHTADLVPEKKLSKSKRKLSQIRPEKKHKAKLLSKEKLTKELSDPLLALS